MTNLLTKKNFTATEIAGLLFILSVLVISQIYIVNSFSFFTLPVLVLFCFIGLILIINKTLIQDIPTLLFLLFLIPLVYLNNIFHYDYRLELYSSTPLIILTLISIATYIYNGSNKRISKFYIRLPLLLMVLFFAFAGIVSILQGESTQDVSYQIFQFLLYLIIFPITYLIVERRLYHLVFYILLSIALIISIEYIFINTSVVGKRFVTFQSGFLPIATAILFAYVLYQERTTKRIFALLLLVFIITGTFMTLTRSLWFTTFLIIILVYFFYLIAGKRMTVLKFLFFLMISIIPLLSLRDTGSDLQQSNKKIESVEYRTKSVSDPLEDPSLLMRIELAYYAFERFTENYFLGSGLGDFLRYQIFVDTSKPIYYPDSSWLYVLWKGGIVGFIFFLWIYVRFIKSSYFVLMNSPDTRVKYISLGLMAGFIGLSFLGIFSPLLVKYKSNALIAFFFAYIEIERNNILNKQFQSLESNTVEIKEN